MKYICMEADRGCCRMKEMTRISKYMYEMARYGRLTAREAVEWLGREAKQRSLYEKLERFADDRELRHLLINGLMENNPSQSREAIERKVRGWLNDPKRGISKMEAIQLCFIFGLDVERADEFIAMVSEEALHWRDPEEIVYIYALDHKMSYAEARTLYEDIKGSLKKHNEDKELPEDNFTPVIQDEIRKLRTKDELKEYVQEAQDRLGSFHNSAYQLFMDFWKLLEGGENEELLPSSDTISSKCILEEYLHKRFIPRFRRANPRDAEAQENERIVYSAVQRGIQQNWPEEVAISRMKGRKADVTRKVLILLFMATDGGGSDYEEMHLRELTPDEAFESMYERIDAMLEYCGFARIDPRVPFDWFILYCMSAQDIFHIDDKMKQFLSEMFNMDEE